MPWNLLGYSFGFSNKVIQIISAIGIYGLTFIIIYLFSSGVFLLEKTSKLRIFIFATINLSAILLLYSYGSHRIANTETKNITNARFQLIHTNITDHHGYSMEKVFDKVVKNLDVINKSNNDRDVIILPEGSVSVVTESNENPAIEHILDNIENKNFKYLIVGSPKIQRKSNLLRYYNSLFNISATGDYLDDYNKVNLVPFGEYVPMLDIFPRIAAQRNFASGNNLKNITLNLGWKSISYIPLICYDGIFSGKISSDGDFLLNITNDIWFTKKIFGKNISSGPWQHFELIRFRSIEEGKPLLRIANYGITAVIDSFGRIIKKLDFYDSESSIITTLPNGLRKQTFFNQHRNLIVYLMVTLNTIILISIVSIRRKK